MYTIGQVSKMFHLPISTLRYYDKAGLFPTLERSSGIRKFSDREIESLRVIACLKEAGMEIKDIKQFILLSTEGAATYPQRKELFETQKEALQGKLQELEKNMAMIQFKCWYYDQAVKDGNEDRLLSMIPDHLPADIQLLFNQAHGLD